MKGYCEMCAYDHHGKCQIDEITWTWYHKKVIREFLEKLIKKADQIKPMAGGQSIRLQDYRYYYKENLLKFLDKEMKELEDDDEMGTIKCPMCRKVIFTAMRAPNYYHYYCDCGWEGSGNHLMYKFNGEGED